MRILIKNAAIVNEGQTFVGSVVVDGENIAEVMTGLEAYPDVPADEVVDAKGCYLLPGIVDTHVHFRDPGLTRKADFSTESLAAAAGGVTTVLEMPNCIPPTNTPEAFAEKQAIAREKCHVNYGLFYGASEANAARLSEETPVAAAGVKLFMGNSTGNLAVGDANSLHDVFANAPMRIMAHCEDTDLIDENMKAAKAQYGEEVPIAEHSRIRSAEACYRSTAEAVRLAREAGASLHVAHVSTARELEHFAPAKGEAVPQITAEVCLPHLLFTEEDYATYGARIKCNPSVKTSEDRDALRAALNDGRIFTIGTDHAPHTLGDKQGGANKAASGIPMVQFSLCAMLDLVDEGVLSIERLVQLMCHNPARLFDIPQRGYVRPGYKADLVMVKPRTPWTLTANRILSKCNWSPLEGHVFHWRVLRTYVNGFLLYNDGHITDADFHGQPVK